MKTRHRKRKMANILAVTVQVAAVLLGLLAFAYSIVIYNVRSGSRFFLAWDALGVVLLLIALGIGFGWFKHWPKWLGISVVSLTAAGVLIAGIILVKILSCYNITAPSGLDYVIIPGAQVRNDGPSVVLRFRLEAAEAYLSGSPETQCIVSGAQGSNEPCTEAAAMKEYLVRAGIEPERIILEEKATSTAENMCYSAEFVNEGSSVGIVTNNFHMYRCIFLAERYGMDNAKPVYAGSVRLYEPNNVVREILAIIKDRIIR